MLLFRRSFTLLQCKFTYMICYQDIIIFLKYSYRENHKLYESMQDVR